jgi:hypothetical protein
MKRPMGRHRRSVRRLDLVVEDLEERLLLSSAGQSARGLVLSAPAAEVAGRDLGPDFPEDEPSSSTSSSAAASGDRLPEADDLASAGTRTAATGDARTASTTQSDPILLGGVVAGVWMGLGAGAAAVSDSAGSPGALVMAPITHQGSLVVTGAPGGDRPPGGLLADEGVVRWPAPERPVATRVRPFESAARGLRAAGVSLPADRLAPGAEAIAPPRGFGLISDALPLFQDSLERAFDRFLTRIKDLGAGSSGTPESSDRWLPWLVLTATAGAGALVRWQRRGTDHGEEPGARARLGRHGLPGLPSAR